MKEIQRIPECVRCGRVLVDGTWYHPKYAPARNGASYTSGICNSCKEISKRAADTAKKKIAEKLSSALGCKVTYLKRR